MYSADIYAALPSDQFAKTITDDPLEFIMMLIREQLRSGNDNTFNPEQLNLIDSPGPEALTRAYSVLWKIGFLDKQLRPTDLFKAAPISVRPESARMILAAYMWEVHIGDIITIAAYIQTMSKASRKIDFARVYAAAMTGRWASLGNFYRMRLTIGDGFIDGIMIYAALCKAIAGGERAIGTWAESMGIPFDDLRSFVLTRDSIMSEMIELEYHITDDHPSIVDSENFADTAARIKHCIYDGYRCNLMIYNGTAYHQPVTGLEIEKPKMFKDTKETRDDAVKYGFMIGATPKYVIYSGLRLKGPSSNGMFVVEPEFTSMLDGFVSPDLTYT
jgi:HrpA-like RNA helicase